jgi:hypothetical protein
MCNDDKYPTTGSVPFILMKKSMKSSNIKNLKSSLDLNRSKPHLVPGISNLGTANRNGNRQLRTVARPRTSAGIKLRGKLEPWAKLLE